jgi:hypothetical protein
VTAGTVTFREGDTVLASAVPLDGSGQAVLPTATLSAGVHSLLVQYSGSPGFPAASYRAQLSVYQAPLTITAKDASKTYGQAVTFAGTEFTADGLVNGDTVTGVTLTSAGAAGSAGVGSYPLVPSAAAGNGLENYAITYASGALTVNPAPLIITADPQWKITGEANPVFTVSYQGFVLGQDASVLGGLLTFSTPATMSSLPGAYAVTPGGLTSGNYAITFVSGTLTVLSYGQATNVLLTQVNAAGLEGGLQNSLDSQLLAAMASFDAGNAAAGVNQLGAFVNHVRAQRGKGISADVADALIAFAQRIIRVVG